MGCTIPLMKKNGIDMNMTYVNNKGLWKIHSAFNWTKKSNSNIVFQK